MYIRKRIVAALLLGGLLVGCLPSIPVTPEGRLQRAKEQLEAAQSPVDRLFALPDAAKQSFVLGRIEDARKYALELKALVPQLSDLMTGNAVHDSHMVLGRIAVHEGRIEEAKEHLLKAGTTPGSPVLDSFGPNMSLAKDLLEKGERQVVLEYFELCREFWDMGHQKLDTWSRQVRAGKVPDFGANLLY